VEGYVEKCTFGIAVRELIAQHATKCTFASAAEHCQTVADILELPKVIDFMVLFLCFCLIACLFTLLCS